MTPQDLLKKTIHAEASKANSDFVEIAHRQRIKKAKVEYGDFRKTSKSELGDNEIQDEISFINAEIAFVSKGDDITLDGVDYSVAYFSLVMPGIYNIFATKKLRTGSIG